MEFLNSLLDLIVATYNVIISFVSLILPYGALLGWVAFWMLGVNWVKFRKVLAEGGVVGVLLLALVIILAWGLIAPPEGGMHDLGLVSVSNFVGKTVFVSSLFVIMFLCGAVQLSGACGCCVNFSDEEEAAEEHNAHAH
jgi:hypothetical protein